jgi:enoyl-CoA hydratase
MSTPTTPVRTERIGSTLLITLDRPEARNAVNAAVAAGLTAALDELEVEPELRAGVLTGEGGTFSAGMDLKAALRGESPEVEGRGFGGLTEAEPAKPLIAAVEGYAMGGGFELALACDLIVAAEDARFGLPEVKRGLFPASPGTVLLGTRLPLSVALEMTLTGDPIDAERARALGLVNAVVPQREVLSVALDYAERIAANGPLAVAAIKELVRLGVADAARAADRLRELQPQVFESEDAKEGAMAFIEKRAPEWKGR